MVSLKQLYHAMALKNHQNFHLAAKSANISQPAFSHSIGALEQALGVTLFNRGSGKITPTIYGEVLLERAARVLAEAGEMEREIALLKGRETGSLSVAMGIYAADISANRTVGEMVKRHPNLQYTTWLAPWHEVASLVQSRMVDLGVAEISNLTPESQLEAQSVGHHRLIFFVRSQHPLLERNSITASDMSGFPMASVRAPARAAEFMPGRGEIDPNTGEFVPSVNVNDLLSMRAVVERSDAIGIAAPVQIEPWLSTGELAFLPYRPPWMKLDYGVIYLKGRMLSPAVEEYIALLHEIDAQQGALNEALMFELTGKTTTSDESRP